MGPSSERSAQSTLPLQILSGVRQTELSLAQGYLGGLQTADSQDSSSDRSSQSMSPSHTQLFVIHLPVDMRCGERRTLTFLAFKTFRDCYKFVFLCTSDEVI